MARGVFRVFQEDVFVATMTLPTFLTLPEAAEKFGLTETELRQRVDAGTITAGRLPGGEIVVSSERNANGVTDINDRLSAIKRDDYEHLRGRPITVSEAAEKYDLVRQTIIRWANQTYIGALQESTGLGGTRMELDEADVAYCATIYRIRREAGIRTGFPLLDESGKPGLLKHPNLSRYRRECNTL